MNLPRHSEANHKNIMIDAQQLSCDYRDRHFDFSCQIQTGAARAIIGKNGAGKSTFLKLLAGFIKPSSGKLCLNGVNATFLPVEKRPISFLFQEHNLFPHLTVQQNLSLALARTLRLNHFQKETLKTLAQQMNFSALLTQKAGTLSGGEQQRVALARVFLQNRPILLLDEPFSALDEAAQEELSQQLFAHQRAKQITLLMITHHLKTLSDFNGAPIEIEKGRIIHC